VSGCSDSKVEEINSWSKKSLIWTGEKSEYEMSLQNILAENNI
jgi:hypothetical protein